MNVRSRDLFKFKKFNVSYQFKLFEFVCCVVRESSIFGEWNIRHSDWSWSRDRVGANRTAWAHLN